MPGKVYYRRKRSWRSFVTALAAIVVFCTTYALILPAITMEKQPSCGLEAHVHEDVCYTEGKFLSCSAGEHYVHIHNDFCFLESGEQLCTLEEIQPHSHGDMCYTVESSVHQHGTACYTAEKGELTCTQEALAGHTHEAGCYEEHVTLICSLPESEGHTHSEFCSDEEGNLICAQEETLGHTHGEQCSSAETVLICQEEVQGHAHSDDCYLWNDVLTCEVSTEETFLLEPVLTCTREEIILHTHSESCYEEDGNLSCTLPQIEEHIHSDACVASGEKQLICTLEEHTHDKVLCYIDETADVETEEQWKATLPRKLTGVWADDLLSVARSQVGYGESEVNLQVDADGTVRGYTRYGAWYSEPYSDWNEIFVSFCLHYAGISRDYIAYESNAERWIAVLSARNQYAAAGEYTPVPGDLVFMDLDDNGYGDTVAIVKALEEDRLTVYMGDTENRAVEQLEYLLSDTPVETEQKVLLPGDILGYGILPENPNPDGEGETTETAETTEATEPDTVYYCGQEEHTHEDSCYDADDNVICEKAEHIHEDACTVAPVRYCGKTEHIHGDDCLDEDGNRICTVEDHTHTEECDIPPEDGYFCGNSEHEHTILCKANLTDLSEEDRIMVEQVILRIDEMPSADEIDAKLAEFEAAEDYEGEEAWLTEVYQLVGDVYFDYRLLRERLQPYVVNADKLMELEYIWSAQALVDEIPSAAPTIVGTTGSNPVVSTSEFVKLNIYDYYGDASASAAGKTNINALWKSNNKYPGFQWNGGAYMTQYVFRRWRVDNIDFGNSMITDYKYGGTTSGITNGVSSNFQKVGGQGGAINQVIGYTNQPIGYSSGTSYDALNHKLINGYPALSDGTSLNYLFSESAYAAKKNTANIDGLFRQNQVTGEYWYDSRDNHAYYSGNRFTLYNQIITPNFILYPFGNFLPFNGITNGDQVTQVAAIDYVVQGYNGKAGYMQTIINRLLEGSEDTTENQLIDMLARYRNSLSESTSDQENRYTWTVEQAINNYFQNSTEFGDDGIDANGAVLQEIISRLYNIDFDVKKNFLFGMDMEMNFMQPKDGMTGNDTNQDGHADYPMTFYFAGDDDVWVFIDGILFLDLTGIHRHVGGDIDFVNGKVNYYMMESYVDGAVSSTPYKTYTFVEILRDIGGIAESQLGNYLKQDANGNYTTFKDYSTHNFKFYYMERGTGSSVCRINFNFPMLRHNTISVNKENIVVNESGAAVNGTVNGNPDYYFNIVDTQNNLFVGPNSVTGISQYKIMDSAGNILKNSDGSERVFTTDQYGIFTLKAGQTAVFEDITENSGEYFVQELIKAEDNDQYPEVYVNSTISRYNKLIEWNYRKYFSEDPDSGYDASNPTKGPYGYEWYGRSGQNTDSSTNSSFYFKQQNHVDVSKLGKLSISKHVEDYGIIPDDTVYRMNVTLDGIPLAVGTEYTLTTGEITETRTVTSTGIIELMAGQTATIPNIISGAVYDVTETAESAKDYVVSYGATGEVIENNTHISGIVRVNTTIEVIVINTISASQIEIPVTKAYSLDPGDDVERTYTFDLKQINEDGTDHASGYKDTVTITLPGQTENKFVLSYLSSSFQAEGAETVLWYQITERDEANNQSYRVKVEIDSTKSPIEATYTIYDDENVAVNAAAFVNTLTGDLTLTKTVKGVDAGQEFGFIIQFETGTSGVSQLPEAYPVTIHHKDGTTQSGTIPFSDNNTHLTLAHGEGITIHGIPIGTKWTIIEGTPVYDEKGNFVTVEPKSPDGYIVSWKTDSGTIEEGNTSEGSIVIDGTDVEYINNSTYELPETGGAGTTLYTMGGLLLMLTAVVLLLYNNIRRRKEDYFTS